MFVSCLEVGKAYENKFQYKMVWINCCIMQGSIDRQKTHELCQSKFG